MPRHQAKFGSFGKRCAAMSLLLSTAAPPASANLPMRTLRPSVLRPIAAARVRPSQARRRSSPPAPTQCSSEYGTTNGDTFFVGLTGNSLNDYAGGNDTAVLAGLSNEACDEDSAIGGGGENDIGNGSFGNDSFIGAGNANVITAARSFVGGGTANEASSLADFIGAGYDNFVDLDGAFVGAGGAAYYTKAGVYDATTGSSNVADARDSFVGAGDLNVITYNGPGSFIGAGSYGSATNGESVGNQISAPDAFIGAGDSNVVSASTAFVGAGDANGAAAQSSFIGSGLHNGTNGQAAFVGAGANNYATFGSSFVGAGGGEEYVKHLGGVIGNTAGATDAFVGAGDLNVITDKGNGSFIGAGGYTYAATGATAAGNTISGSDSFIGAGDQNVVSGTEAFVGSGGDNSIGSKASYASIIGGNRNAASGEYASVIGGFSNTASGSYGIVAGGDTSTAAGIVSFAAGYHADAAHDGSFVWSDYVSGSKTIADTAANQFVVRASGGIALYSNEAATSGVKLAAGSGTWASLSDRNAKADVVPLDDASVLAKVATLPVSTWRYKTESGVRHVGPMAQDFYAAFGVGEDDRHITSIDEAGVELAAIEALKTKIERRNGQIAILTRRVAKLEGGSK